MLPANLWTATLSPASFAQHLQAHLFAWSASRLRTIYDVLYKFIIIIVIIILIVNVAANAVNATVYASRLFQDEEHVVSCLSSKRIMTKKSTHLTTADRCTPKSPYTQQLSNRQHVAVKLLSTYRTAVCRFPLNFCSLEQKFQETYVRENESSWEQRFSGANVLWLELLIPGAKVHGNEKSIIR